VTGKMEEREGAGHSRCRKDGERVKEEEGRGRKEDGEVEERGQ